MRRPQPLPIGPGQESVWDYPRPPRLERANHHIQIIFAGQVIADTRNAMRVLETSHPPTYYLPPADIDMTALVAAPGTSFCEWKGQAIYYTVRVGERRAEQTAWSYPRPSAPFAAIADYVAFYCAPMDACLVDGERAEPQPGGFYGGWVTSHVVGPFKGIPGSSGW